MPKTKLTKAQRDVLEWLSGDGKKLCGPMASGLTGSGAYGCSGGGPIRLVRAGTGDKLLSSGLIAHSYDRYPSGYHVITEAGRAALA